MLQAALDLENGALSLRLLLRELLNFLTGAVKLVLLGNDELLGLVVLLLDLVELCRDFANLFDIILCRTVVVGGLQEGVDVYGVLGTIVETTANSKSGGYPYFFW